MEKQLRFFFSSFEQMRSGGDEEVALHALDPQGEALYTYSQDLKTWNLDQSVSGRFHLPKLDEYRAAFVEISRDEVYELLPEVPCKDLRHPEQRSRVEQERKQVRRSGKVLTSAEVGLLTKPLKQRPAMMPMLKELIETRSQHKRWTALLLYEEDGAARRQAIRSLRNNSRLRISSKGHRLDAQHRIRRFVIDGTQHAHIAVEVKYFRQPEQVAKWN